MRIHVDDAGNMKIPETVCDTLGVSAGGDVELNRDETGRTYIDRVSPETSPKRQSGRDGLDRIRGSLKTDQTTDEMMEFLRGDR